MADPFRYFKTSPEIIRFAMVIFIRFPLLLRNVEALPHDAMVLGRPWCEWGRARRGGCAS